jgi:hypothetical protein
MLAQNIFVSSVGLMISAAYPKFHTAAQSKLTAMEYASGMSLRRNAMILNIVTTAPDNNRRMITRLYIAQ